MFQQVLMVALGGGIGAALRYLTSEWVSNDGFPWATLCVNLVGSFLMGAVALLGWKLSETILGST